MAFLASGEADARQPPAKAQTAKPAAAAAKPQNQVRRLPGTASDELPPGVRLPPPPPTGGAKASTSKPSAKQASASKSKKSAGKKAGAKKSGGKKKAAKGKGKSETVKSGRAALSTVAGVDADQLDVDHLKGVETKSPIELLMSYKEVLEAGDLETAAVLLRLAVDDEPGRESVTRINDLLGIKLDTQDTDALIDVAKAKRAAIVTANVEGRGGDEAPATAADGASRISAAHAAVAVPTQRSAIMALANYKRAMEENNREAAALSLAAAVGRPADDLAAARANALLGIGSE